MWKVGMTSVHMPWVQVAKFEIDSVFLTYFYQTAIKCRGKKDLFVTLPTNKANSTLLMSFVVIRWPNIEETL